MKTPAAVPVPPPRLVSAWPAVALLALLGAWRVGMGWITLHNTATSLPAWLPGFTPLAALAFGGGFLLPRRLGVVAALGMLLASDLALTAIYGQALGAGDLLARYSCLSALALFGAMGRRRGLGATGLVVGSLAGAILFYVVTNTACWLGTTVYPQTFAGWVQALTAGTPGFPPSWVFFRNSLASDLLVSMLLAAVCLPWKNPLRAGQTLTPHAAA